MIIESRKKLSLSEREHIKAYQTNKSDFGIIVTDVINNNKYIGYIIIPHKFEELQAQLVVVDKNTEEETIKDITEDIIGTHEIMVNDDCLMLTIC